MSEIDEVTIRAMALVERTNFAEQRRRALAAYAAQAREDPHIAKIVHLLLEARRERRDGGSNVISLRGRHA